jgi:hypothetical protein
VGNFCPPGSGSGSSQIKSIDPDTNTAINPLSLNRFTDSGERISRSLRLEVPGKVPMPSNCHAVDPASLSLSPPSEIENKKLQDFF